MRLGAVAASCKQIRKWDHRFIKNEWVKTYTHDTSFSSQLLREFIKVMEKTSRDVGTLAEFYLLVEVVVALLTLWQLVADPCCKISQVLH